MVHPSAMQALGNSTIGEAGSAAETPITSGKIANALNEHSSERDDVLPFR
jgi:hypothetical protein